MWGDVFMSSNDPNSMVAGYPGDFAPFGWITQGNPAVPEFYWNVVSNEQRWKFLCINLNALSKYVNAINNIITNLKIVTPDDLQKSINLINNSIQNVQQQLNDLQSQSDDWDITKGVPAPSVDAHRNAFKLSSPYAFTTFRLSKWKTVNDLANCGLNCMGLACFGAVLDEMHTLTIPEKLRSK